MQGKLSIKYVVIASNLVLMLAFLGTILSYSVDRYQDTMIEDFLGNQSLINRQVRAGIDQDIHTIETIVQTTSNNSTMINLIDKYHINMAKSELQVFTNNLNQNFSEIIYTVAEAISMNLVIDGFPYETSVPNGVYSYDRYFDDAFLAGMTTQSKWIATNEIDLPYETYQKNGISYISQIYADKYQQEQLGYLVINLSKDFLYDQIETALDLGTTHVFVLDRNGTILSAVDKDLVGTKIAQSEYGALPVSWLSYEAQDFLHKDQIVSYGRNENGWGILCITESEVVLEPIYQTTRRLLMFGLGIIALITLFSILLSHVITAPIIQLTKRISGFQQEKDFETWIETNTYIKEIAVLSTAFNKLTAQISGLFRTVHQREQQLKHNELQLLQAQINPHFLYNTLETINWMALEKGQMEISRIVVLLGNFLRLSLNKGKWVYSVKNELDHLESYMKIQEIRSGGRLTFSSEIDECCLQFQMIKLLMQPIVENSVLHAFNETDGYGHIHLVVNTTQTDIVFTITDDGCGMEPEAIETILEQGATSGYGLRNVNERILLSYGEGYGLQIDSPDGEGTRVEVRIRKYLPEK